MKKAELRKDITHGMEDFLDDFKYEECPFDPDKDTFQAMGWRFGWIHADMLYHSMLGKRLAQTTNKLRFMITPAVLKQFKTRLANEIKTFKKFSKRSKDLAMMNQMILLDESYDTCFRFANQIARKLKVPENKFVDAETMLEESNKRIDNLIVAAAQRGNK